MTPERQLIATLGAQQFLLETIYGAILSGMPKAQAEEFVAVIRRGLATISVPVAVESTDSFAATARDLQVTINKFLAKVTAGAEAVRAGSSIDG